MNQNNNHKYHYKFEDEYKDKNIQPILTQLFGLNATCNIGITYDNIYYLILTYDTNIHYEFNDEQIKFINQHLDEFELRELLIIAKCLYKQNNIDLLKIIFNEMKTKLGKLTNWEQIYIEFIKLDNEQSTAIYEHYFTNDFNIHSNIEQLKYNIIIMMTLLKLINHLNIDTVIEQFYIRYRNEINELYNLLK